jgi:uncharacterized membrane protein (DUF485 family)
VGLDGLFHYLLLHVANRCRVYQDLFKAKVWGVINFGILFALSEFVVAWVIAFVYSKKANAEFDAMAQEIINDVNSGSIK